MRRIDTLVLIVIGVLALVWTGFSSMGGYKGNNATIVARSIAIAATIDGQVENTPPAVGARVNGNDLLARIHNVRFDRGRLTAFESQIAYLQSEIDSLVKQQRDLKLLQHDFEQRAESFSKWMREDATLKHAEITAQLDVATARERLEKEELERANKLYAKQLTSEVDMRITANEAEIAGSQVELNRVLLKRSTLVLQTMNQHGVFFVSGDTSYWEKMVDTLAVRKLDNLNRLAMLQAELIQIQSQAQVENTRIDSSFAEEHHAPFTGMVSARFVTKGTRVTAGTNLLQILDCTHPVIIVPIPDNRISEFSVGLKVTVYPIDTEEVLTGRINYISSGPMIGNDTSIQVQQDFTLDGNRAIASLDSTAMLEDPVQSCETGRKAVVVIHTPDVIDRLLAWFEPEPPDQMASKSANGGEPSS